MYGPEEKYPIKRNCNECGKEIWTQWSENKQKEYATENKSWEKGKNEAIFHKCWNWNKKIPEKTKQVQKIKKAPTGEPKGDFTQEEALIFIGKQLEALNKLLAVILPIIANLK